MAVIRTAVKRTGKAQVPVGLQLHPENDRDIIDWLNDQPSKQAAIKAAIRASIGTSARPTIEDDIAWLKQALTDLPGYLNGVIANAARYAPAEMPAPDMPPIEATPRLTQDDLQRKAEKMKKKQW